MKAIRKAHNDDMAAEMAAMKTKLPNELVEASPMFQELRIQMKQVMSDNAEMKERAKNLDVSVLNSKGKAIDRTAQGVIRLNDNINTVSDNTDNMIFGMFKLAQDDHAMGLDLFMKYDYALVSRGHLRTDGTRTQDTMCNPLYQRHCAI